LGIESGGSLIFCHKGTNLPDLPDGNIEQGRQAGAQRFIKESIIDNYNFVFLSVLASLWQLFLNDPEKTSHHIIYEKRQSFPKAQLHPSGSG